MKIKFIFYSKPSIRSLQKAVNKNIFFVTFILLIVFSFGLLVGLNINLKTNASENNTILQNQNLVENNHTKETKHNEASNITNITNQFKSKNEYENTKTYLDSINKIEVKVEIPETASIFLAKKKQSQKKYKEAIEICTKLINNGVTNDEVYRLRSQLYYKTGNKINAIYDLKKINELTKADNKTYNKLNPIRKKIVGRCTLCCDGTYSPTCATGRGAC